ncbi:ABC transporter substrate-binding protein [Mesorhizobium sp. M0700]|uniref:ABC transporter substrate-binding protein n=1 Tax=Mesorhizobium sp. M0700 TaxID=2956988 RepID=UPI0033379738
MVIRSSKSFLNRRQVLAGMSALAATPFASRGMAASVKPTGICRFGVHGANTTDTLDASNARDTFPYLLNTGLRNCLTEVGRGGKLIPELAESWDTNHDATQWTFKIRQGVQFHSGKTLTSEDVVETFKDQMRAESSATQRSALADVVELKTDGPQSVIFTLKSGNVDLPDIFSHINFAIAPFKDGKVDWTSGDGTGGYQLESFSPGILAKLKRNQNYWKSDRAHFAAVEIVGINDPTARLSALRGGQVDVISRVPPKLAKMISALKDVQVVTVNGTLHYNFSMNTTLTPFTDVDVRLAMKHLIDRQNFVEKILGGYGAMSDDNPIAPSYRFYNPNLKNPHTYDPDKAKFYLNKAGVSGLQVQLFASEAAFDGATDAATLFSNDAKAGGVQINPVRTPSDGYWAEIFGKKEFFAEFWSGRTTEDSLLTQAYSKGSSENGSHWANERFNELLIQARGELNEDRRREQYYEMQQILHDDSGAIVMAFVDHIMAVTPKVETGQLTPTGYELENFRAIERWSFK